MRGRLKLRHYFRGYFDSPRIRMSHDYIDTPRVRTNRIIFLLGLEWVGPQFLEHELQLPQIIRDPCMSRDGCALDRVPCRPIRHDEDVGNRRESDGWTRELQIMLRLVCDVRPEHLVARFHRNVAPERIVGLKVDAFRPGIRSRGLVTADGRDVEVIL